MACAPLSARAASTHPLTAEQARDHAGQTATVCGNVASTRYAASSRGRPTFLNLDKPYPNQIFTIVIWGENRSKFGTPETAYEDKGICVTGKITEYRGIPEIVARSPKQIRSEHSERSTSSPSVPAGATARCRDGTYSYSQHHRGTCSHHGGVAEWLN